MVQFWGIVGLFLVASIAFVLSFDTIMVGPRWEVAGVMAGVAYGVLAAPIGAAL